MKKKLTNNPLVEAIFEIRWELQEPVPGMKIDQHYKILPGMIYDKVKKEYPFYEQLPTAFMPDEIVVYAVQHRFRKDKDKWPLIQIGPGIMTLNDTKGYTWKDFKTRIQRLVNILYDLYPVSEENLKINGLLLRYINAVEFNYENDNVFTFLKEQLKISIQLDEILFNKTGVNNLPIDIDLKVSFPSTTPKGAIILRFSRGQIRNADALIWEIMVHSANKDVPDNKEDIFVWTDHAHSLIEDWFFKMINGELLRRFK